MPARFCPKCRGFLGRLNGPSEDVCQWCGESFAVETAPVPSGGVQATEEGEG